MEPSCRGLNMRRASRAPPLRPLHPLLLMLRMELLVHLVLGHNTYQEPVSPSLPASLSMPTCHNLPSSLSLLMSPRTPAWSLMHPRRPEDFQCGSHGPPDGIADEVAADERPRQQSTDLLFTGNRDLTYLPSGAMAWLPTTCHLSKFLEHLQPWPHTPSWGRLRQLLLPLCHNLLRILSAWPLSSRCLRLFCSSSASRPSPQLQVTLLTMTLMVSPTLSVRIPDHKMCQPELSIENINTFLTHSRSLINQFLHLKLSTDRSLMSTTEGSIELIEPVGTETLDVLEQKCESLGSIYSPTSKENFGIVTSAFDNSWDRDQSIIYKILKITDTTGDRYFNMGMSLELTDILKSGKSLGANKVPNDRYATYSKKGGYFKPSFFGDTPIQGLICNVDPTNDKNHFVRYQQMILDVERISQMLAETLDLLSELSTDLNIEIDRNDLLVRGNESENCIPLIVRLLNWEPINDLPTDFRPSTQNYVEGNVSKLEKQVAEFNRKCKLLKNEDIDPLIVDNDHDSIDESLSDLDWSDPMTHFLMSVLGGILTIGSLGGFLAYTGYAIMKKAVIKALTRSYSY